MDFYVRSVIWEIIESDIDMGTGGMKFFEKAEKLSKMFSKSAQIESKFSDILDKNFTSAGQIGIFEYLASYRIWMFKRDR